MIYIECYPDLALVRSLIRITRRDFDHEFKGKGAICNRLMKQGSSIGLLDEDPLSPQPNYLKLAEVKDDLSGHGIKVLQDVNHNSIIVLCPRLEEWILEAAKETGIDLERYKLPANADELHREINFSLDKFEKLLDDLKGSSARLKKLREVLQKS